MGRFKKILLLSGGLCSSLFLSAQAPLPDAMDDPFVIVMIVIMVILALIIGLLAWVVLGSAQIYLEKWKKEEQPVEKKSQPATIAGSVVALLLLGLVTQAEDGGTNVLASVHALSDSAFYTMTGVVFLELVVIGALLYNLRVLLEIKRKKAAVVNERVKPAISWWDKFNKFKPIEQEANIDLGHDYDGIRELDNRLPPWWLYSFYCTIIFAGVYLWQHHVSHTAPLSGEEYQLAVNEAAVQRVEYLKKAANNVDESTVKYLPASTDLDAGQQIFTTTCFPCHGKTGEGGVGPNLTDEYWLHGGGVKDIFKTIKYGVPEKGMKSWKDDYSPGQIAQLASFIKSLKGTRPANGKAPQGALYQEEEAPAKDSATRVAVH